MTCRVWASANGLVRGTVPPGGAAAYLAVLRRNIRPITIVWFIALLPSASPNA